MRRSNQRGQSTAEYAILVAVVVAACVGMQLYVKRGMQGKFRDMTDAYTRQGGVVGATPIGTTRQYEPYYTAEGDVDVAQQNTERSTMAQGGAITKSNISNTVTRTGSQTQGGAGSLGQDSGWK